jgi:mannose-1-phosphate guanylyltransferase/mannose-1-phosphate guanylyltransferase/mannose-6-phosphate isomerase
MSDSRSDGRIVPVILSGGAGKRLWPLSRAGRPKQLMAPAGGESLLQQTARRVFDRTRFEAPIVVAGADHADAVEAQLAAIGASPGLLIVEPFGRNTAAAIALAALAGGEEDVLLVMPSDHLIADTHAFRAAIDRALPFAAQDWLVTFGIAPDRPETGYGYIRRGALLGEGVFRAEAFAEKPQRSLAEAWLAEGGHDWNAGIFLFRAGAFVAALGEHGADILAAARSSIQAGHRDGARLFPDPDSFARAPALPVDVAVMERSDRVAVAPADMGWSDVGSWDSLYALGAPDSDGNVLAGDVLTLDSRGCLVRSDGRRIVTIGVQDLIVIATDDGVLVVPRGESQRVKEALDALEARRQKARDPES